MAIAIVTMLFVHRDEKGHSEEIGRAAWAESAHHKTLVHFLRTLSPAGFAIKELLSGIARKSETASAVAMEEIGIFKGGDEGKARFDARRFGVIRSIRGAPFQSGQADLIVGGKSIGGLHARAATREVLA
jgi:hypothetical protein